MAAVMAAKIAGCLKIIAVDIVPERLELAKEFGATDTINAKEVSDVVAKIKEITDGGAHYSIEVSGNPELSLQAIRCLRRLGTAVVSSVTGPAEISLAIEPMIMNPSITFAGLVEGASDPQTFMPKLVEYYKAGQFPIDRLVDFYQFEDIGKAFEDSHTGKSIKPILIFD